VAWLDVSNAFGAIPHLALETAIESCGAGEGLLHSVRDLYSGATSSVIVVEGKTSDIPVLSNICQVCPLSGLLFTMGIDPVVSELQGQDADHRVLVFADDLCLLTDSAPALQSKINEARDGLPASSHFIRAGDFCRFADWRFVHLARLNLVPLNGSSS